MPVAANQAFGVVQAPPARPPIVGLIAALTGTPYLIDQEIETVLDNVATGATIEQRWEGGIQYQPESVCSSAGVGDPCGQVNYTPAASPSNVAAMPFIVQAGDTCSTFGWEAHDFKGRATRALLAVESKQIAHELWTGRQAQASGWPNPFLANPNAAELLNSSSSSPADALALLEQGIADFSNGQPAAIHVTRQLGSALSELGNTYRQVGTGLILTYMGNVIIPDAGYPGTSPTEHLRAGGFGWAYATLMPTVRRGQIQIYPDTYEEAIDHPGTGSANTLTWYAERLALVTFDPCVLVAVEVNLPTPTNTVIGS